MVQSASVNRVIDDPRGLIVHSFVSSFVDEIENVRRRENTEDNLENGIYS